MAFYNTCCHLGKPKRLRDGIPNRWHPIFARERRDGKCEIFATPNSDTKEKCGKNLVRFQKPSKVSFELTPYIYIYVRTEKHLLLADVWQTLKSDSLILQHPRSLCLSYELHKYIQWLDESGSHRCPTWWTAWKGRCSPTWWWCNCPGSQVFFDGTMTRMSFFFAWSKEDQQFFCQWFCCFKVLALPSKTQDCRPQSLLFFFCPASTWGLCRRFRIWSNDVPTPGCQCPIWWAVSCVAADVLFRVFHLFFQKTCPWAFLFLDHWKAELNIKSLGNFGINCQYLRKSQFLLPSCLPTSSTSPVFEVKRFITTGRQGILVVEVRLLLLVTTSY